LKTEVKRQRESLQRAKHVIDNNWSIPIDPNGDRIKTPISSPRINGMNNQERKQTSIQNRILLEKMGAIMQGNYKSSTKSDFQSCKCYYMAEICRAQNNYKLGAAKAQE